MARTLVIEEESGTMTAFRHQHNGYYAGDFFATDTPSKPQSAPRYVGVGQPQTTWCL